MAEKLVLIDGHSILHRAYFGVPELTNSEGIHTNAVYGFLNIMFKILDEEKPDYLIVAFDEHAPTFRHEVYSAYKGTRKPMEDALREQVPLIKDLLTAMGIKIISKEGIEADDILGTLAKEGEREGLSVSLVSGDRDLLQIASDNIKIRIPKTKRGGTEIEDYFAADVKERYGVTPGQFIELKALMGDASDNIPGVPKVGEKTAVELIKTYGSLENIFANVEEISKKSIRESLKENKDLADLSLFLATIKTDCELPAGPKDAPLPALFTKEAYMICRRLGLKSYLSRFDASVSADAITEVQSAEIKSFDEIFADITVGELISLSVLPSENEFLVYESKKDAAAVTDISGLKTLKDKGVRFLCLSAKGIYGYFYDEENLSAMDAVSCFEDAAIGAYLIDPLKGKYPAEDIISAYSGKMIKSFEESFGKCSDKEAYLKDNDAYKKREALICKYLLDSFKRIESILKEQNMYGIYRNMELPLSYVLFRMENEGIRADSKELAAYSSELDKTIKTLEERIWFQAGTEFNINSPKQLGVILFEQMGLKGGKKTKTGYSTAADVLEKLAPENPIIRDILEYRTYAKLKSTYTDSMASYISEDGRIHTKLNQCVTATGRLSSSEPNLQNIPMRYELGRRIRKVFKPKDGFVFVDADYSQIELRILASLAGDENLIEAYKSGEDIHTITASKVFHIPADEVDELKRRNAKAVNFGIVYGISTFGLSEDLSITKKEAENYINEYFLTYPGIKAYLDRAKSEAKEKGYSLTAFGRRRPIPELRSSNFMQRQFGERVAMNAPVQGTAADVIKIAMIRVYDRLLSEGLRSRLILQIHDELLVEAAKEEETKVLEILKTEMEKAADMPVSLIVSAHSGADLYEVK